MEAEKILLVHSMLHLIFHRNKNQHGAESLQHESSSAKSVPSADVYRRHLATHVVPGCYLAFSTVVADGQFSTLGVVLLATLARLSKAAGIDKEFKAMSRAKNVGRIQPYEMPTPKAEDIGEVLARDSGPSPATSSSEMRAPRKESSVALPEDRMKEPKMKAKTEEKKPKKKSKKKKDAIDDLFAGLL
ncbi:hypothetical protein ATEIFO6365_0007000800 [Aspergillus terreus]|uniref:RNase MRP protein 1 RNA binding domain-containing protein n=1 Tax=Aspergillus terreus TaxID=33178 RepID=A0A5M3Z7V0_ASPTE|nr:hypothetical protein ATETN484_0009000800 [Aspergillus terreus]GFF17459.1 hypothetical protein ATEIFO6365_0007000800 [Aspergillus terreus]